MNILMVASEAAPFAKTGGLADVVGALPRELEALGHEVAVVLPRYRHVDLRRASRVWDWLPVWLGAARYDASIHLVWQELAFYFVDCPALYDRAGYYGEAGVDYPDNHLRFAVLARAALEVARHLFRPRIFHTHDWQAGLLPVYLKTHLTADPTFLAARTLFTIHNLGYQGLFPRTALTDIGLDGSVWHFNRLEHWNNVCLIKGGINYADWLNTVSPTYAREIQTPEYGFGLDGALRAHRDRLSGILNGVDYREWNPETDGYIAANYSAADLAGKRVCKRDLLHEFGLGEEAMEAPLIGMVSRLTSQKGADLVAGIAHALAGTTAYLVVLGTGDPESELLLQTMAAAHPGKIAVKFAFDNALAHKIEAGSDLFLMPSRYEPCGLNQIYSLKYGTVPIVRATGGLDDTIEEGTGFKFWDYDGPALMEAIRAALDAFSDRERWRAIMLRGMAKDFSWRVSATEYARLYERLLANPAGPATI